MFASLHPVLDSSKNGMLMNYWEPRLVVGLPRLELLHEGIYLDTDQKKTPKISRVCRFCLI